LIDNTTKLNKPGRLLSELAGVNALTDVTGFGVLGHLLELARGAKLSAKLNMGLLPLLPQVQQLAEQGYITGASGRNWSGYGHDVKLADSITPVQRSLLTDPQTSGGLLVSCDPGAVEQVLELFRREGFSDAAVIGEMTTGESGVQVLA